MNAVLNTRFPGVLAALLLTAAAPARAWDYEGHRLVNQLALASLPTNFPGFVFTPAARERIAFLAGEPDRWRNTPDLPLKHFNGPDHFLDIDLLNLHGLEARSLSPFRYDFVVSQSQGRLAHANNFPPGDSSKDADHTRSLIGLLPWTIVEYEARLKSVFSYLREFQESGTHDEIANSRENAIYVMGVMGHFVGDGAQPLHTTKHHHGWVGDNPHHYTTNFTFHQWIDGGYLAKYPPDFEKLRAKLRPARLLGLESSKGGHTNLFGEVMQYLIEQHEQVEPLYRLDKQLKLSGSREFSQEGHDFITGQIIKAAQNLGDLWLTAWQQAPPDTFLRGQLARRKLATEGRSPATEKKPKSE
jgi:hypothetical protein